MSPVTPQGRLARVRSRIDRIDQQILELLQERGRAAKRVAAIKRSKGSPIYSAEREEQIIRRLAGLGDGSFPFEGIRNVFHEILSTCLKIQGSDGTRSRPAGGRAWRQGVAGYIESLPAYVPGQARRKSGGGAQRLRLSGNENNHGPSPHVLRSIRSGMKWVHRYPDKWADAPRQALARRLGCRSDQIVLGNGSDELIDLVFRTFLRPGKEALLPHPSFTYYEIAAQACGARPVRYALPELHYRVESILERVNERTALVVVANPNNPTGTYLDKNGLSRLLKRLPDGVVILLDEAYWGYPWRSDYPDGMKVVRTHSNLVVMRTASKILGLAGLRCAFAACDPSLADILNRLRQPFNVNILAQAAVVAAMKDSAWLTRMRNGNRREMTYLAQGLQAMGARTVDSQANFILAFPPPASGGAASYLAGKGIEVRDTSSFGIPGAIRVTIGRHEENARLLGAMRGYRG